MLMRDRRRDIPPRAKKTQDTDAIPGTQFYSYWLLPPCVKEKQALHAYDRVEAPDSVVDLVEDTGVVVSHGEKDSDEAA